MGRERRDGVIKEGRCVEREREERLREGRKWVWRARGGRELKREMKEEQRQKIDHIISSGILCVKGEKKSYFPHTYVTPLRMYI